MKKLILGLLSATFLFIVGCSGQEVINVKGISENWESKIAYEIGEHEQIGRGFIKYLGSEQLDNLSYEINYPATFSVGGDGNMGDLSEDSYTSFPLTINLPSRNIDMVRDEIENISITIVWENVSGDSFEETIELQ
ncbi:hypothetical protein [Oceanobacillus damuensis]|uniref:hypothetical protein n=1 Tax=Oceanobacillus damuensis TaxID=937928 RepID=UPI0008297ADE|nr:hypothetical protein [Oceanobacillus damuensis]